MNNTIPRRLADPIHIIQGRLSNPGRRSQRGFTLIEVMVVVAIVGILTAIALPSYSAYVLKSHRVDAKTALLDLASREERFYAINNRYSATPSDLGLNGSFAIQIATSGTAYYQLEAPTIGSGNSSFSIQATALGSQIRDSCGNYTLTSVGAQGNSGAATGCW